MPGSGEVLTAAADRRLRLGGFRLAIKTERVFATS